MVWMDCQGAVSSGLAGIERCSGGQSAAPHPVGRKSVLLGGLLHGRDAGCRVLGEWTQEEAPQPFLLFLRSEMVALWRAGAFCAGLHSGTRFGSGLVGPLQFVRACGFQSLRTIVQMGKQSAGLGGCTLRQLCLLYGGCVDERTIYLHYSFGPHLPDGGSIGLAQRAYPPP